MACTVAKRVLHPVIEFVQQQVLVPFDAAAMLDFQLQAVGGVGALALRLEGFDIDDRRLAIWRATRRGEIFESVSSWAR